MVGRPSIVTVKRMSALPMRLHSAEPSRGAVRDRGQPVRRPRRRHQHHAPAAAGPGGRGRPPGPQPVRRRGGHRRHPGGRPGGGRQLLPGRPRRVLHATWSTGCGPRGGATSGSTAGGGGTIVAAEIDELQRYGVARIFSPQDGQAMGLAGHGQHHGRRVRPAPAPARRRRTSRRCSAGDQRALARVITAVETGALDAGRPAT